MMISFELPYRVDAPPIARSVEACPRRWTHHVMAGRRADITPQLMRRLDEAYHFSQIKR